ncbi:tetratricopeptide repeat protein [Allomesorhizobium alhagi]|nr:tetratricopeptide repeat protein [Mesorhizobium alhagi]
MRKKVTKEREPKKRTTTSYVLKGVAQQNYDIRKIRFAMEQLSRTKDLPWYEDAFLFVEKLIKYVAIPSAILASILPISGFISSYIERINQQFIESRYLEYASELLEVGKFERARNIIISLENQKKLNTKTQYFSSKLASLEAEERGNNLEEAVDSLSILILLNKEPPIFFPNTASKNDLVDLYLSLIDVEIENGQYNNVSERIKAVRALLPPNIIAQREADILLRDAHLAILEQRFADADNTLANLVKRASNNSLFMGELRFLSGKSLMFQNKNQTALVEINASVEIFKQAGYKLGLMKAYNNLGFVYLSMKKRDLAIESHETSLSIAKELNIRRGVSRSNLNIAVIEKGNGNVSRAEELSLLALADFLDMKNQLGIFAAANNLISIYKDRGDLLSALKYAQLCFDTAKSLSDIRGIASAAGFVGDIKRQLGVREDSLYFNMISYVMYRHVSDVTKTAIVGDILTSLSMQGDSTEINGAVDKLKLFISGMGRPDVDIGELPVGVLTDGQGVSSGEAKGG